MLIQAILKQQKNTEVENHEKNVISILRSKLFLGSCDVASDPSSHSLGGWFV